MQPTDQVGYSGRSWADRSHCPMQFSGEEAWGRASLSDWGAPSMTGCPLAKTAGHAARCHPGSGQDHPGRQKQEKPTWGERPVSTSQLI